MFLYYLPESLRMTAREFVFSRPHVFSGKEGPTVCSTAKGPDGSRGVVCAPNLPGRKAPERVGYYPEEQIWQKTSDGWWIGHAKGHRPAPADLARVEAYPGHNVTLEDGSEWLVAIGRLWDGSNPFPKRLQLDPETGEWAETLHERFVAITERAGALFADIIAASFSEDEAGHPTMSFSADPGFAVDALGLNYHVGEEEVSLLGALTSENIGHIAQAFLDFPTWAKVFAARDDAKKKASQKSSDTDSGVGDSCAGTLPRGQISGFSNTGSN